MMKKRRNEKGELMSQPILFIFAAVVGAMILFYGIRTVFQVKQTAELAEVSSFISNLEKDLEQYYYLDTGSSKVVKLNLPGNIQDICFRNVNVNTVPNDVDTKLNTLMQINPNDNLFVYPIKEGKSSFKVKYLVAYPKTNVALCFKNKEDIKITSLGDHVGISTKDYTYATSSAGTTSGTGGSGLNLGVTLNPEDLNFISS